MTVSDFAEIAKGKGAYERDYAIGSVIHGVAHKHPGMSLVVVHHTRKGNSDDFIEKISGTNGLAGAADNVVMLSRDRSSSGGELAVTGRETAEGEYGVSFDGGRWAMDGLTLKDSAQSLVERRESARYGGTYQDVVFGVMAIYQENGRVPVVAKDVADRLEMKVENARVYLARAVNRGALHRPADGQFVPVARNTDGLDQRGQV